MNAEDPTEQFRISATIRDINRALVPAASLPELETAVCETFAAADPYVFAWIGAYDADTAVVVPRTAAGRGEAYCDDLEISVDEPPTANGPTAKAIRTDAVQVVQNIQTDPDYEPWREDAFARGYRASAAVPLRTAETAWVLNVYTDRPNGFDENEQALLVELGKTIENAIDGITARRELQAQKEKYEQLAERVADGFYAVDTEWTITYWNDTMAERTGIAAAEVLDETLWDVFPALEATKAARMYRQAMATNEATSFEVYLDEPYEYWIEVDVYPDADGLSMYSREITERKAYEQQLEAIITNTTNPIYIKNRQLEYQFLNDATAALFGFDPDAVVGETDERLFDAESAAEITAVDRQVIDTGTPVTREAVTHIDGREHVFLTNKFPYRDATGTVVGVMGISHDITGRKAGERDLEETKRRLDMALEATETGVWEHDLETGRRTWNESMGDLFGFASDTHDRTYEEFMDRVHPDDMPRVERAHQRAIETDGRYEAEYRIRVENGTERWIKARGQVVTSGDDRQMIGIATDVTERKARERRLEEQNEKLEVLNRILRHDIRNDMQIVVGLSDVLANRTDDDLADYADRVLDHADHVVELTRIARDLMETVLQDETDRQPVALDRTLDAQLRDVHSSYEDATVTVTTPIPRRRVYADEMLGSVFRNILKNAIQHNDSDRPAVEVSVTEATDSVTIHVADDGPGIPPVRWDDIFGKGTKGLDSGAPVSVSISSTASSTATAARYGSTKTSRPEPCSTFAWRPTTADRQRPRCAIEQPRYQNG